MESSVQLFIDIGEPFAAGLFELEGEAPLLRYANALKRFFEFAALTPYNGNMLYPSGKCIFHFDGSVAVQPHYANTMQINFNLLKEKDVSAHKLMKA